MTYTKSKEVIVRKYMNRYYRHFGIHRVWRWFAGKSSKLSSFVFGILFGIGMRQIEYPVDGLTKVWAGAFILFIVFGFLGALDWKIQQRLIKKAHNETNRDLQVFGEPKITSTEFTKIITDQGFINT